MEEEELQKILHNNLRWKVENENRQQRLMDYVNVGMICITNDKGILKNHFSFFRYRTPEILNSSHNV